MANTQTIGLKLSGFKQLDNTIRRLPQEMQKKAYQAVMRAGAAPIRKKAKANLKASKDSGLLMKSIGIRSVVYQGGVPYAVIGARRSVSGTIKRHRKGKRRSGKGFRMEYAVPANYAHLVEYGTAHSPAKPFMRPAVDSAEGEVFNAMANGLDKHLTRVLAKLKKS